ncbi:mannose-1-phosphate guanylyltransferase/mannose-6-phosphate isomerase [Gymnodinialimonas ceratoperidinii]|uniref:Mannose-1-phosphate guanylyltransferase/mannose-6-phosphate isomerase n=1 Tax=Gymnodinialimonas ceratoperidinii TaxID=2856823 RepID=A0A8F6TVN4_9RHOB|nr:mannose-1-phosphate guanylyltransferase/mannose-6-phosphate isomerase [Gymnodinialimonas ceratoperidinii]QXT39034.1 mannose-1-phosphate guanylyltransferase/mannose-6-phosphate isomerase [Gymnodinialimonas ceratoperidinii]
MTDLIHPVLLCGGSGTRLWPLSRKSFPKQFVQLVGEESLFQSTARRLSAPGFAAPALVTASDFRFIVLEQLAAVEIGAAEVLIEPTVKNTAPAVCAAALSLHDRAPGALMLVVPSDHVIPDATHFRETIPAALPAARDGQIVTFGVRPDRAETGYGWLALSRAPDPDFSATPQKLKSFVEKPDPATAEALLAGGMHLWNSGIFLFSTTTILAAFQTHAPEVLALTRAALQDAQPDLGFTRLAPDPWEDLTNISIDYAVMEQAQNMTVVPYDGAWSDLGDWQAVWRNEAADGAGVVTMGPSVPLDCTDTLLHATHARQELVGIGLDNIIAVAMPDAVLVAHKDRAQDVKEAVAQMKARGTPQAETLPRDYRPWGWYESLIVGPKFQVKRITVHPGAALSLQSHKRRAEHWVVVEGRAQVTIDTEVTIVEENQSVYIPIGARHRLENPAETPLTLIEVQTGDYFGEDDIHRYEDLYARGLGRKP